MCVQRMLIHMYVCGSMCLCVCLEPEINLGCCVFLRSHPPFSFFKKKKRFLLLTVCIDEEYDVVNLNIILSDARQRH